MAQAIGPHFEKYLSVVAQVLNQSSTMSLTDGAFDMFDYFISLREGILDAWDGAILAMKQGKGESYCTSFLTLAESMQPICCGLTSIPSSSSFI